MSLRLPVLAVRQLQQRCAFRFQSVRFFGVIVQRPLRWRDPSGYDRTLPLTRALATTAAMAAAQEIPATDPTTYANYGDIASEHIALEWAIDWDKKVISGSATHTLRAKTDVTEVIFDTSALVLNGVLIDGTEATFALGNDHPVMGASLTVTLPKPVAKGQTVDVKINYSTTPTAVALQWLDKDQTAGKKFPFIFSQCQPIFARTLLPCQDTPSVKTSFTAEVTSTLPVLLSAIRISPPSDAPTKNPGSEAVTYKYKQPVRIPSYLIAIAAGDVVYRQFPSITGKTWTSGVWAEPDTIEAAYWEFSEHTARFLAKAEDILAPYVFGVYDMLVLPPSFPYGGMENACLTFLTPTLLAGDRSLVDVVAHELTHSYFGNGVTHAHASHFWLNEGWTTYFENVLLGAIHSDAERGLNYIIGKKSLDDALKLYADRPKYQQLVIPFERGEDPDDAYSTIPYEKGSNFLLYLENTLGGKDVLLRFASDYVNTFTGKSITTDQWKEHLYAYFKKNDPKKIEALDSVDWDAWFFGQGESLPVQPQYDTTLAEKAYALAKRWDDSRGSPSSKLSFKKEDLDDFTSNEKTVLLEKLDSIDPLSSGHIHAMDAAYGFNTNPNAEIRSRFYTIALKSPAKADFAKAAADWVVGAEPEGTLGRGVKGRMKFCRPLFRALKDVDEALAKTTWENNASSFHPIARKMIEKDLGIATA
ncbi:peptidase family M1-domain-containing protein [Auriculariales sp. MPI-PUGE-AT-0066]|nr:peptidase family M1-domain-containing protein [Auriculariales sp. MPI-PUGE-AT-0066]